MTLSVKLEQLAVLVDALPDLMGTGRGLAGLRGLDIPLAPWLQGPPGLSRGLPGPLRIGMGLPPRGDCDDPWDDTCESKRVLDVGLASNAESM